MWRGGKPRQGRRDRGRQLTLATSSHFDTTAKHADLMGEDSPLVLKLGSAGG